MVSRLDSQSKGCGFESHLVLSKILDGIGLKAMPGLIPASNPCSFIEKKQNRGSQMAQIVKKINKKVNISWKSSFV